MKPSPLRHALPVAAMLLFAGCGEADRSAAPTDAVETAGAAETGAAPDPVAANPAVPPTAPAPFGAADIDAIARGLERENAVLTDVAARVADAADDTVKLNLMASARPSELEKAGADAAGLDASTYRARKERLFTVLGRMEMREMIGRQVADLDTGGMDDAAAAQARANAEAMQAQLGDPFEGLDPAVAEVMRARHDELAALRANNIALLIKAAGG